MKSRSFSKLVTALASLFIANHAVAQEEVNLNPVSAAEQKIENKRQEIKMLDMEYEEQKSSLRQLQNEQVRMNVEAEELELKRNRAKAELDLQYTRLLDDPDTDLVTFQKQYQDGWNALKAHQSEQLKNAQSIEDAKSLLSQSKHKLALLNSEYTNLQESMLEVRVKRLEAELKQSAVLETRYTTNCSSSMTLGECSNQGQYLTKQKVVNAFKAQLIDGLTESQLVKQNLQGVQLNIHVQESQIIESGFSGSSDFNVHMKAQLQARPETTAACNLLGLSTRYCLNGQTNGNLNYDKNDQSNWVNLTVRSDQYADRVTINGVNYGSTPVELMLPKGEHQVTVSKQGYETFNRVIKLANRDTVWVKLLESNKE